MARKFALLIIIALFVAFVPTSYGDSVPPELTCGDAPFGAPVGKVLEIYKDSKIVQEATPYIESIGNYALERHFKGGLKRDDSGICFLPNIVKKYSISHDGWKNCSAMTLYFGAFEVDAKDYELFMVKKTQKTPAADADFKKVFEKMAGKLDWETVQNARNILTPKQAERYRVFDYLHEEMGAALAFADLPVLLSG